MFFKCQSCLVELKSKWLIRLYVVSFVSISISSDQLLAFSRSGQAWKISSLGNAWNDNWNLHPLMKLSIVLKSVTNEKVVCLLWILLLSSPPLAQARQKFAPAALPLLWRPACNELVASGWFPVNRCPHHKHCRYTCYLLASLLATAQEKKRIKMDLEAEEHERLPLHFEADFTSEAEFWSLTDFIF